MGKLKPFMRWIIAAVVLLVFVLTWVLIDRSVTLDAVSRLVLGAGLVLLGLAAAGAVVWFLRPREILPVDTGDDVLLTIGSARARLPRGSFLSRPMVLVLGPEGSAKTSLVARSGGDPELLAGVAPTSAGEAPVPTKTANVWAMQGAIVTELGGALLSDAPRWTNTIRALRAPRVAAAVSQDGAAARAAVVCVPCSLFYAGGNGQQLEDLGRALRQRLAEASRELGLAMPVYVVFTQMDRIPHFESWVGVFTKDELRAPLGATLPFDPASTTGNYAERLTPRIEAAYQQFVDVVSARRVDLLARESVHERRYGSYELPRELRKILAPATAFLVELCRPTQLGSSPQLRGFYFAGARPVVVSDVSKASVNVAASGGSSHATGIFRDIDFRAPAPVAPVEATVVRKIPEWVFVDRFLRDVVLADSSARALARGGVQVERTRRTLLGAAIAASLLLLVGITASWTGNRALGTRVGNAARAVAALPVVQSAPGTIAFPSRDALGRLEALRVELDTLRRQVRNGPPAWMRLGLWNGQPLFEAARPMWYEGFRTQLFATARGAIVDSLQALPETPRPTDDREVAYGWLRTYLITTSDPARSTSDLVTPVLLSSWQRGQTPDADVTGLARKQFDFYASELPAYNPWPEQRDEKRVSRSRAFLGRFTVGDQIYPNMIAAANKATPPVKIPQAPDVITVAPEVVGAFTPAGETLMIDRFRNFESYEGEPWVVGDASSARDVDRDAIIRELRARYQNDYILAWRGVLQNAKVVGPNDLKDAMAKLDKISGTTSPLLAVMRTVAVNTNNDSVMRGAFQPVHAVTPPAIVDKFISEKNEPYVVGLVELRSAVARVDNLPASKTDTAIIATRAQAAREATSAEVANAEKAEKRLESAFLTTPGALLTATHVQRLLMAPIRGADAQLKIVAGAKPVRVVAEGVKAPPGAPPPGEPPPAGGTKLNERGARLCSELTPMLSKFPFNPDASADATIADVTGMLAPGTGKLWAFYQDDLSEFLPKQGEKYAGKPGKGVTLTPAFVEFFNRAATVSAVLFADGSPTPHLRWNARAATSPQTPLVILTHGRFVSNFDERTPRNVVDWPAEAAGGAKLEARFGKEKPAGVGSALGEWAIFRLVTKAATEPAGRDLRVTWPPTTAKNAAPVLVTFEPVGTANGALALQRGWFGGMTCVGQVAQ